MQIEDYFEFETCETKFGPAERIRVKGHRIGIEHVLAHYKEGFSPEAILHEVYPTLNLAKIHATILYYLANMERVESYIRRREEIGDQYYQDYLQQPETEVVKRMRALIAEKETQTRQQNRPHTLTSAEKPIVS